MVFLLILQYLIFAKVCTMYFNFILQNKFYYDSRNKTAAVYFVEFLEWPSLFMLVVRGPWVVGPADAE